MTDITGVRVITYFADQVDEIAKVMEGEFNIDIKNSIDKRDILDPDRFGYLSLHYVIVSLSSARCALAEYRSFSELKAEVQVRSILQHAWAEIEHDLGYIRPLGKFLGLSGVSLHDWQVFLNLRTMSSSQYAVILIYIVERWLKR